MEQYTLEEKEEQVLDQEQLLEITRTEVQVQQQDQTQIEILELSRVTDQIEVLLPDLHLVDQTEVLRQDLHQADRIDHLVQVLDRHLVDQALRVALDLLEGAANRFKSNTLQ